MLESWKQAVVNLECATDSVSSSERVAIFQKMVAGGGAPSEEALEQLSSGIRDVRSQGTAIFLKDETSGHRFLATARHVVFDELEAQRRLQDLAERYTGMPPEMLERMTTEDAERARDQIFNMIFRVPSLTEVASGSLDQMAASFLMNLGAGVSWLTPYSFSNPDLDLAVISLDGRRANSRFADTLERLGHQAIPFSQIADGPSAEGVDLYTVGYPGTTSPVGMLDLPPELLHWRSRHVSLPTFSFGKAAMLHELLPYFWADLTIYPGNSGGPVVENGSLVGIVVQQAVLREPNGKPQRVPFCKAIRSQHLKTLLKAQIKKDAAG